MIRVATADDIPAMVEHAKNHLRNCNYSRLNFNIEKAVKFGNDLINNNHFFVVYEKDGEVVGGMLGAVTQPWFSDDLIGTEYLLYIDPEARSGRVAYQMIKSWLEYCKLKNCIQIRPSVSSGNFQVVRLYEKMGFRNVGANFLMEN